MPISVLPLTVQGTSPLWRRHCTTIGHGPVARRGLKLPCWFALHHLPFLLICVSVRRRLIKNAPRQSLALPILLLPHSLSFSTCMYLCTCIHLHTCTDICTYIYIYTHMYTYVRVWLHFIPHNPSFSSICVPCVYMLCTSPSCSVKSLKDHVREAYTSVRGLIIYTNSVRTREPLHFWVILKPSPQQSHFLAQMLGLITKTLWYFRSMNQSLHSTTSWLHQKRLKDIGQCCLSPWTSFIQKTLPCCNVLPGPRIWKPIV